MLANLHTVAMNDAKTLCVRCDACGHRGALGPEALPIHRANMKQLIDLKLRCANCGGRDVTHYIPFTYQEAGDFLAYRCDLAHRRESSI